MSNIHHNRVKTTIPAADMADIRAAFQTIETKLDFLVGISPQERRGLPKMRVRNKVFTEDVINAMRYAPQFLPGYISLAELERDMELFEQLNELLSILRRLSQKMEDTQILAGTEAYSTALVAYQAFKISAQSGMAGADTIFQGLRENFLNHKSKQKVKEGDDPEG